MAAPSGLIVLWTGTNAGIPAGWSRVTALDSKIAKGSGTAGSTGGADTHTHPDTAHTHTDNHTHANVVSGAGSGTVQSSTAGNNSVLGSHTHSATFPAAAVTSGTSTSGNSSSGNSLPDYYRTIYIKSDGTTDIPQNAVMFWGQATTLIPATWTFADGNGGTTDIRTGFFRGPAAGADSNLTKVTAAAHSHTFAHTHPNVSHSHTVSISTPSHCAHAAGMFAARPSHIPMRPLAMAAPAEVFQTG